MEAMTTMSAVRQMPPSMAPMPPQGGAAPAPQSAIQPTDLFLSPAARKLREIEMKLGAAIEQVAQHSVMAARIQRKLEERRNRRRGIEEEMLEALRRYNGAYSGAIKVRLESQPTRSHLWVDLTRMKCDAAHAEIMDVLRGPSGDRPWGLKAADIPETTKLPDLMVAMGVTLEHVRENYKARVRSMEAEIGDQLDVADFPEALDRAVWDGVVVGTGVLHGPFTVPDREATWDMVLDVNMQAKASYRKQVGFRPWLRHVPVFHFYPDMESADVRHGDPIEVMPMSRRQFMDLAGQPGINPAAVIKILREYPRGNYNPSPEIMQLRQMGLDNQPSESTQYEVICYYGEVSGQELRDAGAQVEDEYLPMSVTAELWVCGPYVLRARHHKGPIPYHAFNYRKRGSLSPFGKGMAMLVHSSQDAINGAARMIMDNAAIASGPLIELNMMLMKVQPGTDPANIHGWKVFFSRHDGHSGKRAVFIHQIPAYTEVFIQIINLFRRLMDEESGQSSQGAGMQGQGSTKTATGMSILNANAGKMRNHTLRYIDDQLLEPLIEGFYDWNMRYSTREEVLVPAKVQAKGTQNLMSREVESQRLLTALQIFMGHPAFRDDAAMKALFRTMGLPVDDLVVSEMEMMRKQMMDQAEQQAGGRPLANRAEQAARGPTPPMEGAPPVGAESGRVPDFGVAA